MTHASRFLDRFAVLLLVTFWPFGPQGLLSQPIPESPAVRTGAPEVVEAAELSRWAELHLQSINTALAEGGGDLNDRLERIRALYFLSVEEGDWVDVARDSLSALRSIAKAESEEAIMVQAYRGAIEVVRAKHSRWPPNKLKYLNRGAEILDGLVDMHPEELELRYLRLASYLFLPVFLKRSDSVAADMEALAAGLPLGSGSFSPPVYRAVLRFMLENGTLEENQRVLLEQALENDQ